MKEIKFLEICIWVQVHNVSLDLLKKECRGHREEVGENSGGRGSKWESGV